MVVDHHRFIRQQRKQQQILLQQELAYVKQLKYTNKLEPSSVNAVGQANSYQNLNYNIEYQNLDNLKSAACERGQKTYMHLKHIENVVYKQQNNLSVTNIGWNKSFFFLVFIRRLQISKQ